MAFSSNHHSRSVYAIPNYAGAAVQQDKGCRYKLISRIERDLFLVAHGRPGLQLMVRVRNFLSRTRLHRVRPISGLTMRKHYRRVGGINDRRPFHSSLFTISTKSWSWSRTFGWILFRWSFPELHIPHFLSQLEHFSSFVVSIKASFSIE